MPVFFADSELQDLICQVERGERLDGEAGLRLMRSNDLLALGHMANIVRERKNGNKTYFIVNRHINQTEGMHTNARILYGHETVEKRINHLLKLRELQDSSADFLSFTAIPFYLESTQIEGDLGVSDTTGFEDLKVLAVSRILLDNFDHIKTSWLMLGQKLAQVSLAFGVDELDGLVVEGPIVQAAGAKNEQAMSKRALVDLIQKAGRDPQECDTLYQCIIVHNA